VEFKVFNGNTYETLALTDSKVVFKLDQILGSVEKPHILNREGDGIDNGYHLSQNKPNPFTDQSVINFTIPRDEAVKLTLMNQYGAVVKVLVDEHRKAGNYQVVLSGKQLQSGIYIYILKAGDYVKTRKLIVIH
jgi:hypothetical protein